MPFTIHQDEYKYWLGLGTDAYKYEDVNDSVSKGKDKLSEVRLYPAKLATGNFGLLNIGAPNQGTPAMSAQITDGVQPSDINKEIGTSVVNFVDSGGNAITHNITGNTGLKAALENAIKTRIGNVVAIFVHDKVSGSGANTVYRTTGVRFVRVLDVSLQGGTKYLWIQPTTYTGPGLITNPKVPSSGGNSGQFVLAR